MITLDAATGKPTYSKGKVGKVAAPKGGRAYRESVSKSFDVPRGASLPQIANANANAHQIEFRRQLPSIQPEKTIIDVPRPTSIESAIPSGMEEKCLIEKLQRRIQEVESENKILNDSLLQSEESIKSYRAFLGKYLLFILLQSYCQVYLIKRNFFSMIYAFAPKLVWRHRNLLFCVKQIFQVLRSQRHPMLN